MAELLQVDSPQKDEIVRSFMCSHDGEYIEFNGTIIDWYDEVFWVGISFDVSVEDSEKIMFSWDSSLSDLKLEGDYHYSKYHCGLITEGMKVHMIVKIDATDSDWHLDIEKFEIIE